jgi:hypothetical protein
MDSGRYETYPICPDSRDPDAWYLEKSTSLGTSWTVAGPETAWKETLSNRPRRRKASFPRASQS